MFRLAVLWPRPEDESSFNESQELLEVAEFTLPYVQGLVGGGYVEVVTLADGCAMYINEDGKDRGLMLNQYATMLALEDGRLMVGDYIRGPAVIVGPADEFGRDMPLPESMMIRLGLV